MDAGHRSRSATRQSSDSNLSDQISDHRPQEDYSCLQYVDLSDADLICHFLKHTSKTLALRASDHELWQVHVIAHAKTSDFLYRGILSIAALHLHHIAKLPVDSLYHRACTLQNEASALFRSTKKITKETTFDALIFCVIVAVFHLYVSQRDGDTGAYVDASNVLRAIRGGAQLVQHLDVSAPGVVPPGLLGVLWKEPPPLTTTEMQLALDGLEGLQLHAQATESPGTSEAIEAMRCTIERFGLEPKGWLHIIVWPALMTDAFIEQLEARKGEAMAVFLYWCAIVNGAMSTWFLDGWATAASKTCLKSLDDELKQYLYWPLSKLNVQNKSMDHGSCIKS